MIDGRPAKYRISLKELRELMEHRGREGIQRVQDYGGVQGIMERLYTSEDKGLSGSKVDIEHRRETFGSNVIPPKPPKTFFQLVCEAVQDITLIILIISATISLGLSFYKPDDENDGNKYYLKIKMEEFQLFSIISFGRRRGASWMDRRFRNFDISYRCCSCYSI